MGGASAESGANYFDGMQKIGEDPQTFFMDCGSLLFFLTRWICSYSVISHHL